MQQITSSFKERETNYRWKAVFINQQKESWTHDFCLFSDAEQDKTLSEEKLALFKEAKLGKKKKAFPETRMKTLSMVKMFFK